MGDLLRQGCQFLAGDARKQHVASPVTYSRPPAEGGETIELELAATPGKTEYEKPDEYGMPIGAETRDFIVSAEDFTGTFGEPNVGDRIVSDGSVFEVLEIPGRGCWEWLGVGDYIMRIHTKRIGAE